VAAFPWGPLFAWSPLHPGYRQMQFSRADVLYPNGAELDPAYHKVDSYVAEAETVPDERRCYQGPPMTEGRISAKPRALAAG
jgi:hypothetical protein